MDGLDLDQVQTTTVEVPGLQSRNSVAIVFELELPYCTVDPTRAIVAAQTIVASLSHDSHRFPDHLHCPQVVCLFLQLPQML